MAGPLCLNERASIKCPSALCCTASACMYWLIAWLKSLFLRAINPRPIRAMGSRALPGALSVLDIITDSSTTSMKM